MTSVDPVRQLEARHGAGQGTNPLAGDPTVGGDVVDAVEPVLGGKQHGGGEIVEVEELGRRVVLAETLPHTGRQRRGQAAGAVGCHRDGRSQHGDRAARHGEAPLVGQLLDRRRVGGRRRTRRRAAARRPR